MSRQSKENQGKILAFPWILLAESGLFNGLQRIQIKNFLGGLTRVAGCGRASQTANSHWAPRWSLAELPTGVYDSCDFCLIQVKLASSRITPAGQPHATPWRRRRPQANQSSVPPAVLEGRDVLSRPLEPAAQYNRIFHPNRHVSEAFGPKRILARTSRTRVSSRREGTFASAIFNKIFRLPPLGSNGGALRRTQIHGL